MGELNLRYQILPDKVEDYTLVLLDTTDVNLANIIRKTLMNEIPTLSIDIVIFDVNTSVLYDELIAAALGQCVIDNEKCKQENIDDDFMTEFDITGRENITEFTTKNIPDIPFVNPTPIIELLYEERIKAKVIVKRGKSRTHVKWRPVAAPHIREYDNRYYLYYVNIGMMLDENIMEETMRLVPKTLNRPITNIFFKPQGLEELKRLSEQEQF